MAGVYDLLSPIDVCVLKAHRVDVDSLRLVDKFEDTNMYDQPLHVVNYRFMGMAEIESAFYPNGQAAVEVNVSRSSVPDKDPDKQNSASNLLSATVQVTAGDDYLSRTQIVRKHAGQELKVITDEQAYSLPLNDSGEPSSPKAHHEILTTDIGSGRTVVEKEDFARNKFTPHAKPDGHLQKKHNAALDCLSGG